MHQDDGREAPSKGAIDVGGLAQLHPQDDPIHDKAAAAATASVFGKGVPGNLNTQSPSTKAFNPDQSWPRRIVIADASVLIYSLRTVHDLLKDKDVQVVVPNEDLATLDVLKKGEHILNLAARRATRYIDERVNGKSLILQPSHATIRHLAQQQRRSTSAADQQHVETLVVAELEREAPVAVRETLYCALYYMRAQQRADAGLAGAPSDPARCVLAVALPPPHMDEDILPPSARQANADGTATEPSLPASTQRTRRFAERADGRIVMAWARRCGIDGERLHVAPTAASWLAASSSQPSLSQR